MAKKEMTYSAAMAEIEAILAKLRSEQIDVDTLGEEVERAAELIAACRAKLRKAENDVKKIVGQ